MSLPSDSNKECAIQGPFVSARMRCTAKIVEFLCGIAPVTF
jgi:hypothetical protein